MAALTFAAGMQVGGADVHEMRARGVGEGERVRGAVDVDALQRLVGAGEVGQCRGVHDRIDAGGQFAVLPRAEPQVRPCHVALDRADVAGVGLPGGCAHDRAVGEADDVCCSVVDEPRDQGLPDDTCSAGHQDGSALAARSRHRIRGSTRR